MTPIQTSRKKVVHTPPAFTLVELLVVIVMIGILAALLLVVLDQSKQQAQGTYCVNNLKQMQAAWTLYADDSAQVLAPNMGDRQPEWVSNLCWVVGNVRSLPDETNTLLLSDSLLGPYTKNVSLYKCPADPGNPSGTPRVRSVSMNNYMHGKGWGLSDDFVQNTRASDIRRPASSFVFLDERSSTINDGYFVVQLTTQFSSIFAEDMPANYHVKAGGLSFADGHAELKKWQTPYFQASPSQQVFRPIPNNIDYEWLMENTTVPADGTWPSSP
jgi:prepilin-type N-terminal cleavage/methylation domain-containing protein